MTKACSAVIAVIARARRATSAWLPVGASIHSAMDGFDGDDEARVTMTGHSTSPPCGHPAALGQGDQDGAHGEHEKRSISSPAARS